MVNERTEIRLLNADCLEGMKALPDSSIDLVVTSPPYNLGIAYGAYQDDLAPAEYLAWTRKWVTEVKRVLKDEGSFFLNIGAAPSNPLRPYEVLHEVKDLFVLQNSIHWIKSITLTTKQGETVSAGHFKPINSKRFLNDCHEFIFHLTKTGQTQIDRLALGVPYEDKSNINRWKHTSGHDKRCRGNTWFIPYKTIRNRKLQRPHPATFPVELVANCIRLHGLRPDLVMMDPFVGIGHAAFAAQDAGIQSFVGFDIDPEYIAVAESDLRDRLSAGQANPLLLDSVPAVAEPPPSAAQAVDQWLPLLHE